MERPKAAPKPANSTKPMLQPVRLGSSSVRKRPTNSAPPAFPKRSGKAATKTPAMIIACTKSL
jgi:hypothetical protein